MRSFIYGRYDALHGDRGYQVFGRHPDIQRDTVKQLAALFSSDDPNFRILQYLGEFALYAPFQAQDWLFAKGQIEERGDHYSYIVHGVLMDEEERRTLADNPFFLASRLNPLIGDRRELPPAPQHPGNLNDEQVHRFMTECLVFLANQPRGEQLALAAGELATRMATQGSVRHQYDRSLTAPFWALVYFLLPAPLRTATSLCSLAPFFRAETQISGLFGDTDQNRSSAILRVDQPQTTELGTFLKRLAGRQPDEVFTALTTLTAAQRDFSDRLAHKQLLEGKADGGFPARDYLAFIKTILRGVEKPSVHTLGLWSQTLTHQRLFPLKAQHYLKIWHHNSADIPHHFPDLEERILVNLKNDWLAIENENEQIAGRLLPQLEAVVEQIGVTQKANLLASLLESPSLAQRFGSRADEATFVDAIMQAPLSGQRFTDLVLARLTQCDTWPTSFSVLFDHNHFSQSPPALLARVFDLMTRVSTRRLSEQLLEQRFKQDPECFRQFLQALQTRSFLPRFLKILEFRLSRSHQNPAAYLPLLKICSEEEPELFRKRVKEWIGHRELETFAPILGKEPSLAAELLELWAEALGQQPAQDPAIFRLYWLAMGSLRGIPRGEKLTALLARAQQECPVFVLFPRLT